MDWKRIVKGILGMGVTFGALGALFFSILAVAGALFFPGAEDDLLFMIIAGTTWSTVLAVSFSSLLAVAARGRSFDELTLARIGAVGMGAGLAIATILVGATWGEWPNGNWIVPFTTLPLLGAGGGIGTLLLARTAGRALGSSDASPALDAGPDPSGSGADVAMGAGPGGSV